MKKIHFNPISELSELTVPYPKPARKYTPEWYSKSNFFEKDRPDFSNDGKVSKTIKACVPFKDAISFGYIQETWQEINIHNENDGNEDFKLSYSFPTTPKIMIDRASSRRAEYPISSEFYPIEFAWHPQWIPELPNGYSAIITHPFNRIDLPFYTFTGIVDHDKFISSEDPSNLPFLIKKDFSGIIPKGTPMYQIIPFKRDNWKSVKNTYNFLKQTEITFKTRQYFWSGYKKIYWTKKIFN